LITFQTSHLFKFNKQESIVVLIILLMLLVLIILAQNDHISCFYCIKKN